MMHSTVPMVLLWNEDGVMLYNDAYSRFAGGRHPELLGTKVREGWPEVADFNDNVMRVGLAGGTLSYRDHELTLRRHGHPEQVFLDLAYSPVLDESGRPGGVLCVLTETTERVRSQRQTETAEAALREAKETLERRVQETLAERNLLADVVESTDAIVQIVALDYTFLAINRAAADEYERMFGFRPKAGDNKLDLCRDQPTYWAMAHRLWGRALAGEEFAEVHHMVDRGGQERSYEMRFNVLRDAEGRQIGASQFAHEITERLNDHRRLAEAQDALRQSQKMEAVGQLVAGLAHDFNNVLGAVIGALDLIGRRPDDGDRVRRFAEAGLQAAERGSKLTSQLLAFSRSQRIELKPIFVCDVIENLREMLTRTLGPMIELDFGLNPDPVPVLADATQVEMTVLNLALNARDAMPEGGRLSISTSTRSISGDAELADGDYVELTVADTGTGMDRHTLSRAMDPFFTTKPLGKGTGLGLAQVYGSIRQAGGAVRIESVPAQGTAVRVLLPRTDLISRGPEDGSVASSSSEPGRGRVLVVDDDFDMRGMIVNSLETLGFSVLEAADGAAALAVLETTRPDALVVDFAMPGMTGAELAAAARDRHPDIPIVIASGYADSASIERAVGTSARLLRKPFRVDELLSAVSEAIRMGRAGV
jgi:PAS domain S-box-containing protein